MIQTMRGDNGWETRGRGRERGMSMCMLAARCADVIARKSNKKRHKISRLLLRKRVTDSSIWVDVNVNYFFSSRLDCSFFRHVFRQDTLDCSASVPLRFFLVWFELNFFFLCCSGRFPSYVYIHQYLYLYLFLSPTTVPDLSLSLTLFRRLFHSIQVR